MEGPFRLDKMNKELRDIAGYFTNVQRERDREAERKRIVRHPGEQIRT